MVGEPNPFGSLLLVLLVVGGGAYLFGRFFWALSKFLSKPLSVIVPIFVALATAVFPHPVMMLLGILVGGLIIQQLLLVASIATLESQVHELKRMLGPNLPATLKSVEMALAPVAGAGPVVDHSVKANPAGVTVNVTVNGDGPWLLKLFAAAADTAYPDSTVNAKDFQPLQSPGRLKVSYGWENSTERYWWAVLYRNQRPVWRTDLVDRENLPAPEVPMVAEPVYDEDRTTAAEELEMESRLLRPRG